MSVKNDIYAIRDSLLDWLKEHRHGVMGTVIFHLVLAIFLVCVGISRLDSQQRMEIEIDMPEPEIVQQKQEEQKKKEQILQQSADEEVNEMLRSLAVNEDAVKKNAETQPHERVEEYIEQIQEEIDSDYGGRYRANKNKHYKEDSIRVQRDKKERMLDSLQSTVYVGKSSVSYNIKGRYKTYLPIPVYKCEFGGKIVVAVVVNRQGRVIKAEVVDAESNKDDSLREVAVDAALKSEFNVDEKAPERQTGTITYNFVKQSHSLFLLFFHAFLDCYIPARAWCVVMFWLMVSFFCVQPV